MPDDLYDRDLLGWSRQQAEVLKSYAPGSNIPADWGKIIEEIEDLGSSQRAALESHLGTIIEHLLKLRFSPAQDPRNVWRSSVRHARSSAEKVLRRNPSLRPDVASMVDQATKDAAEVVAGDLLDLGEIDRSTAEAVIATRFSEAEVLWDPIPWSGGRGDDPIAD